ncbi:Membrane protein involved in the export of O-antigen and teichoic acid [Ectopseudomonas toyotomiensis]|uniref:Membrane protein involved in the export of O-antigen and teichoic acid n=2 Tax=Ectopseudomonas toyotomiensis TaxID=554344 RepID=A0A1I5RDW2_9GAMM|nr:Membrane protein involved in the export of O-antigen and teichoic acid [Pseudomonas toyotomiensis]
MTAALMVIAFSQIFWEAGMGKALIQRQTELDAAANAAFWINITLAVFIVALLYMSASSVARNLFQDERVTAVLKVMTLQVILGALGSVQSALLQKDMGFKKLFWIRFSTVSLPGLASVPLAWHGLGYWALVVGTLFGQLVQVFMLWRMSKWKPCFGFDGKVAIELSRFGAWVGITGLLVWFYQWADAFVVGFYLGGHELGLYRMGNQLVGFVFALLIVPILPVIYSVLASSGFDKNNYGIAYNDLINKLVQVGIVLGVLVCVAFLGGAEFILGDSWKGVGVIAAMFGLIHGFAWIVGFNGEYYRAAGMPHLETLALVVSMPLYLACYVYFAAIGLQEFLYARFFLVFIGILVHLLFISKVLSVDFSRLGRNFLITSIVAFFGFLVGVILNDYIEDGMIKLFIIEVSVLLVFVAGLMMLNKKEFLLIICSISVMGKKK